jgi:hypothetical protein
MFLTFLDLLRSPDPKSDGGASLPQSRADRVSRAFQRAFGSDLDRLESDWHRFMASVQTPLEQHAPTSSPDMKADRPEVKSSLSSRRSAY